MTERIDKILDSEVFSYNVYSILSSIEKDKRIKNKLEELKELDKKHIKIWEDLYEDLNINAKIKKHKLNILILLAIRRILGIGVTISVINSLENRKISSLSQIFDQIPSKFRKQIVSYLIEEIYQERIIKKESWEENVLSHIRDVVFGMNDGLVEVLAAVSGFTGAIKDNLIIAIAGGIVGISGTI